MFSRLLSVVLLGGALCAAGLALVPRDAVAGQIDALQPNSHALSGSLAEGGEHYVPLDLPEGTLLMFQLRPDRKAGSALVPEAELVGPDGVTIGIESRLISTRKGYDVKKLPVPATGRHILVLRGLDGSSGAYTLKVKAKYPKKLSGVFEPGGGPLEIPFAATTGAKVNASVKGAKGGAVPELPRVRQPNGNSFGPSKVKQKKTGFAFSGFEQQSGFGTYALTFQVVPDTASGPRSFKYAIKVAFPKTAKAKLGYADLIVAPLVTGVTPTDLPIAPDLVPMQVTGRFFQPGATFVMRLSGQPDWRPEGQVTSDTSVSATITTLGRAPGRWDVAAINPSGGQAVLAGALLVRPATPAVTAAEPPFTFDDLTEKAVTLRGSNLSSTTSVEFTRALPGGGTERFVPTRVQDAPIGSGIAVTISPLRRPLGAYDVTVFNPGPNVGVPGSAATTAPGVFEIRNAPPRLISSSPDRYLPGGSFPLTVTGAELEPGLTMVLFRDGEDDVVGTGVAVGPGGTAASASFDMDGAAEGLWSLRVTNADGQSATLDGVFGVVSTESMSFTYDGIGEPSMALDAEHDLGLVAWVDADETSGGGANWKIRARMFDSFLNTWSGPAFDVSTSGGAPKRYVSVAYNPSVDQWLVVWTEHTFAATVNERVRAGLSPTSGTIYQVYGRRVGIDGAVSGGLIDFIDGSASATGGGQVYQDFEYMNPQVVYGPWDGNWYMTFTQQWDALTGDDFDAFVWRLAAADPKLDPNFHHAIHTTQNHESDCLAAVDDDRDRLFIVGSCDSRQQRTQGPREIEGKHVTKDGSVLPGSGGSNVGEVIPVTSRGSDTQHFTNPRPAYNPEAGEYLVVYERVNEGGSGRKEIRAQRIDPATDGRLGVEIVVASDSANDLILPRVVYNALADEYLVTWTVDAGANGRARAQRLASSGAAISGNAFDLGPAGSGLPIVVVDELRGSYTRFVPTGLTNLGSDRKTTDGATLEIFE